MQSRSILSSNRSGSQISTSAQISSNSFKLPPRRVLLTNDDGPSSQFFPPWARYVREVLGWEAVTLVPALQQSFVSKALGPGPIAVRRRSPTHYEVAGSPAACVNIALYSEDVFPAQDCDLVVSGPNVGHNLGRASVLSSGTVGAAMEGALAGARAIAVSYPFLHGWNNWTDADIDEATQDTGAVVQQLWENWDEGAELYNVNVPLNFRDAAGERPKPQIVMTSIDKAGYSSLYRREEDGDADSSSYVWAPKNLRVFEAASQPGSDISAVKEGNVSVSALKAGFIEVSRG